MRVHTHRVPGERRWYLFLGGHTIRFEGPSRWRGGPHAFFSWGDAYRDGFGLSAGCWWFVHLGWEIPFRWRRFLARTVGWPDWHRDIGVRLGRDYSDLSLGYDSSDSSNNRRWQSIPLWRSRWVLGRDHAHWTQPEHVGDIDVEVNQWAGDVYTANLSHRTLTQKNRWRTKVLQVYELDLGSGIPIPGKGENSWDCGDDAICGVGYEPPMTLDQRITTLVADVLATRLRHGGPNWRPALVASPEP